MNREEFATILYDTVVPSNLSEEAKSKKFEKIGQFVSSNLPERLFRYRRCDERSIEAFYKNQVWASTSESMNDGFDTRLYFDRKTVNERLNCSFSAETLKNMISRGSRDVHPESGSCVLPGMEGVLAQVESMSEEQIERTLHKPWEELKKDSVQAVSELVRIVRKTVKFSCFSESIVSPAMWGHYASDESGFALAYEFEKCGFTAFSDKGYSRQCMIFPVIYGTERYKVPDEYVQYLLQYRMMNTILVNSGYSAVFPAVSMMLLNNMPCPDIVMWAKMALHKSVEWETEQEWRLFCTNNSDAEFTQSSHGHFIQTPVALYLGRRISKINQKILTEIAKEKDIPVYEMRLNDDSPTYDLIAAKQ